MGVLRFSKNRILGYDQLISTVIRTAARNRFSSDWPAQRELSGSCPVRYVLADVGPDNREDTDISAGCLVYFRICQLPYICIFVL